MILTPVFAIFSLISLVFARAAPRSRDSPRGIVYQASFTRAARGSVAFSSFFGYVVVRVRMETLPQTGRPIQYDIHDRAVPRSGNCLGTQDILNPYSGTPHAWGWAYQPVGDLSGKHGELYGASAYKLYIDPYLSLNSLNRAFVGGLGLVFHSGWENLDCATITYVRGSSVGGLTAGSGANAGNADKVEVVNGVTEIVGAEYAHETMDLEHVSAELPSLTDDAEFSKETRRPPANAAARTDGGKPRANPGMSKETEKPVGENAPRMKKRYMPA